MQIIGKTNFNFLKWQWHAIALSTLTIVAGLGQIVMQGGPKLGVDFSGGTAVVLRFAQPVTEDAVRLALDPLPGQKTVQQFGAPADHEVLVRLPQALTVEQGTKLDDAADQVDVLIRQANLGEFTRESTEIVGPVVGAELQQKGIYATLAALAGIMVYVGFRFKFTFATGAVVATFHDLLVTLVMLNWFGYELSLNIVAALLTMTGYSVNDTIVIFDRVRENFRMLRGHPLPDVVNTSVNQTMGRTIITSGTTFVAVLGLFLFGGEVLHGFAFTMVVGIIVGTYSSVFIASPIAILLTKPTRQTATKAKKARSKA